MMNLMLHSLQPSHGAHELRNEIIEGLILIRWAKVTQNQLLSP